MHAPIKGYVPQLYPEGSVTQWFGENPDLYRLWDLDGHNGIDIVAPHGTPLLAVEDGTIAGVKYNPDGYGKYVILHSTPDADGNFREWIYGHCSAIHVVVGKEVKAGDTIALMGNTGFVVSGATPFWKHNPYAGTHLHLTLRLGKLDETGWYYDKSQPRFQIKNYDNGYKGAIDPVPYMSMAGVYGDDRRQKMLTIISILNTIIGLQKKLIERKASV